MTFAVDVASWAWPQWTYATLMAFNLVMAAILDGQPKTGNHSAGVTLIAIVIAAFVLTAGGFFA